MLDVSVSHVNSNVHMQCNGGFVNFASIDFCVCFRPTMFLCLSRIYEGRSINKLQNGILLIFKNEIRNMGFVRNLILRTPVSFITMTSLWCNL